MNELNCENKNGINNFGDENEIIINIRNKNNDNNLNNVNQKENEFQNIDGIFKNEERTFECYGDEVIIIESNGEMISFPRVHWISGERNEAVCLVDGYRIEHSRSVYYRCQQQ